MAGISDGPKFRHPSVRTMNKGEISCRFRNKLNEKSRTMLYFFNMVWPCTCEGKFCFSHSTYCDCDMMSENQLARNSCPRLRFSVWALSCRCRVKFSTQSAQSDQPCRNLSHKTWRSRSPREGETEALRKCARTILRSSACQACAD